MNERQRIKTPPDNYGRLYIDLLESPLSSAAKLVFGAMWSFGGQDAWASLESIGRRASLSRPTVIKAQAELQAAGWITLDGDKSKGRLANTWWLRTSAEQKAAQAEGGGNSKNGEDNGKAALPLTVKPLYPNKEVNKELKKETPAPPSAAALGKHLGKHRDQDQFWIEAKAAWAQKHNGATLGWPLAAAGFSRSLWIELERLGAAELARRWRNCVNDPWSRPSLRAFILDTDKWTAAREAGKGQARPFFNPASDPERRPTGGEIGD